MFMGKKGWLYAAILAAVLAAAGATCALAAEHVISSVKISIETKLEPGDTLPDIQIGTGAGDGDISISVSSGNYYISDAKWTTSTNKELKVGDKPEMKVWLSAGDNYYFKGSYRSSNVTVRRGTFVSASRDGQDTLVVRLRVNAVEGNFEPPEDVYWKDNSRGTARWEAPESGGTGKYEVELRRGSSKIHSLETTSRSYNFYPYMTTVGTYTFRVRTIAKTTKEGDYGKKSEWVESDEMYLAKEDVSDGSGRTDAYAVSPSPIGNINVGWRYVDNYWYYYYPDGSCQKDSWLKVNDKWYLFQSDGKMLRGWQRKGNQTYLLGDDGAMMTGWVQNNGRWYYLNPTPDGSEGALLHNQWANVDGKMYYFNNEGVMAEGWYQVDGNWYYFYPGAGNMAADTWIDSFYVDPTGVWRR